MKGAPPKTWEKAWATALDSLVVVVSIRMVPSRKPVLHMRCRDFLWIAVGYLSFCPQTVVFAGGFCSLAVFGMWTVVE